MAPKHNISDEGEGMTEIVQLGYVTVGIADIPAFADFAANIIGAEIGEQSENELLLRNDRNAYRVRAVKDPVNDVLALGWHVPNLDRLDQLEQRLRSCGLDPKRGTAAEAAERRVLAFISVADPDGIPNEIAAGPMIVPERRFNSPLGVSFLTGDEGMGHAGIWSTDLDKSVTFYRDQLGLRICDRFDGAGMRGAFLRCNDRQHSLAIIERLAGPAPRKLHHIEFEYTELDDVGRAFDRAENAQVLMSTLGKHSAEEALCFYMYTPAGFGFEVSYGGTKIYDHLPETSHGPAPLWGLKFVPPVAASASAVAENVIGN